MKNWFKSIILFFTREQVPTTKRRSNLKPPSDWTPRDVTPVNYLD